jgi:hypothetical protein
LADPGRGGPALQVRGVRIATIAMAFGLFTHAMYDIVTLPRL